VLLHVDVANVTGALRVYESVGMRAVLEIDAWAKGEQPVTRRPRRRTCGAPQHAPRHRPRATPAAVRGC
jgi:hypothetical protein